MKAILPKIDIMDGVINFAKKCFTKPQFQHLREYLGGLITLPNKTISSIATASITHKDQSSLNRFLTCSEWNEEKLHERYLKKAKHLFHREKTSLIIDDSISKKTGEHIEDAQYHKDHCSDGYVFGHQIVTAMVKAKDKVLPLFPRLYSKRTESKIEIAKELIQLAVDKLRIAEVIMDSWYTSTDIIKLCLENGLDVIGCIKSNRNISTDLGVWLNLKRYNKQLKERDFQITIVDEATYRIHKRIVRLKHVGFVKLLISQEWMQKEKKWSKSFYIFSTNTKMSAVQIIRTYAQRWSIETFHRDIKQNLGLEACQVRGRRGITRHLILVCLAYAVLKLWMYLREVAWTVGEVVRYIQGRLFDDLIITLVEEESKERRWQLAEPFITKTAKV